MGDFISAVFEGIPAFIELCLFLALLFVGAIIFSIRYLAKKPPDAETRFSGKRLLVAFAPLLLLVTVIAGGIGLVQLIIWVTEARIESTRTLVTQEAERLANQLDESGRLVKHPEPTLDTNDAWGNALHVTYKDSLTHQTIKVRSAGHDRKLNTWDDITRSQTVVRRKRDIAKGLFDKMKGAIEDRLRGEEEQDETEE